jgi:hypothetical protein
MAQPGHVQRAARSLQPNSRWHVSNEKGDALTQFGLDAIDLRWTLKDIDSHRTWLINNDHLPKLIELGLVEMREDVPYLTGAGRNAAWQVD